MPNVPRSSHNASNLSVNILAQTEHDCSAPSHREGACMVDLPPFGNIVELDGALVCGHGQERSTQGQQHGVALRLGKGQCTLESPLSGEKRRATVF